MKPTLMKKLIYRFFFQSAKKETFFLRLKILIKLKQNNHEQTDANIKIQN